MLTVQEAWQIQESASRAEKHEIEIDNRLRMMLMSRSGTKLKYEIEGDKSVAQYLASRYSAAGWTVKMSEFDPERVTRSVVHTLEFILPDPPMRGGPNDR